MKARHLARSEISANVRCLLANVHFIICTPTKAQTRALPIELPDQKKKGGAQKRPWDASRFLPTEPRGLFVFCFVLCLLGLEPGSVDSESTVLTNYTTGPLHL